jgi:hypothetical protein
MTDRGARLVPGAMVAALLVGGLLAPTAALGAPRPGESCPDTTAAPGATQAVCGEGKGPEGGAGGGSFDLAGLLPILAAAGGGAVIALGAAFVVLRRRSSAPAAPPDPGEWWTCRNCGRNNVVGSPRCYACGEWQA